MQKLGHPVPLTAWYSRGGAPWLCVRPRSGGCGDGLLPSQRTPTVVGRHQKEASKGHPPHTGKNLSI